MSDGQAWKADRLRLLEQQLRAKQQNRMNSFQPYPKQAEFLAMGAVKRERLLSGGTQCGKSETGAFEMACHLTGSYGPAWRGKRFDHPVQAWAAGISAELVRDVSQTKLCGLPGSEEDWGIGMIPKTLLLGKTAGHGVTDGYDTIRVRHGSGGVSVLGFKAYQQGRAKFQGSTLDLVWMDEEGPEDIYSEALARLTGDGIIYTTCTPLLGFTPFINRFMRDDSPEARQHRGMVRLGIADAQHWTEEEKQRRVAGYPIHERAARMDGTPMLGEGAVFPVLEGDISTTIVLSEVPRHWPLIWGVDFGISHPFAAVLLAWDRDSDVIYVVDGIRMAGATPLQHADRMKRIAPNVVVAYPHDGEAREKGSGQALKELYRSQGLRMRPTHAQHANGGGFSTEAGIMAMLERMTSGRFKVASHLRDWWDEYRAYHRKDGIIVKVNDDLLSATRIGVMDIRHAQTRAETDPFGRARGWGSRPTHRPPTNPWTGRAVDPR